MLKSANRRVPWHGSLPNYTRPHSTHWTRFPNKGGGSKRDWVCGYVSSKTCIAHVVAASADESSTSDFCRGEGGKEVRGIQSGCDSGWRCT